MLSGSARTDLPLPFGLSLSKASSVQEPDALGLSPNGSPPRTGGFDGLSPNGSPLPEGFDRLSPNGSPRRSA